MGPDVGTDVSQPAVSVKGTVWTPFKFVACTLKSVEMSIL